MKKTAYAVIAIAVLTLSGCASPTAPSAPEAKAKGSAVNKSESPQPPGQFPSGNPAHAPGCSNPNTVPSSDCKNQ